MMLFKINDKAYNIFVIYKISNTIPKKIYMDKDL